MKLFQNDKQFTRVYRNALSNMKPKQHLTAPLGILALLLTCILAAPAAHGAAATSHPPERMTYQGYLVDANGVPLGNTAPINTSVIFRIWKVATGSVAANRMWTEQQTVTIDKGYFSVVLGDGNQFESEAHGDLSAVFSGSDASDRFLGLTIPDIMGANELLPRITLVPSPYAFLARYANGIADDANGEFALTNTTSALRITKTIQTLGGNARGTQAVDMQDNRSTSSQVASGNHSVISGGRRNTASGADSVVGGGDQNVASGNYSAVPGGLQNTASGLYSFAAGRAARALHQGSFVWADSGSTTFSSSANNQFLIKASGGVGINTTSTTGNALTVSGNAEVTGTLDVGTLVVDTITQTGGIRASDIDDNTITSAKIVNGTIATADLGPGLSTLKNNSGRLGINTAKSDVTFNVRPAIATDLPFQVEKSDGTLLAKVNLQGKVTATSFEGAGSALTSLNAANITSGTINNARISLTASKIPNLGASKITSGTLGTERIPNLDASKITSGTLGTERIPNLDASKITSGTFDRGHINSNVGTLSVNGDGLYHIGDKPLGKTSNNNASGLLQMRDTANTSRLAFDSSGIQTWTNNSGYKINDADNVLRLQPGGGRVAIGSDTAGQTLYVRQNASDVGPFRVDDANGNRRLQIASNGNFGNSKTYSDCTFTVKGGHGSTGDNYFFLVEDDSSTTSLFHVHNNQNVYVKNAVQTSSDRRLKKDISSLPPVLAAVSNLRPTTYHLKDDPSDAPKRIGFIAQEVQELFPGAVTDNGKHLSLSYDIFGVLAIKAIQEQQAQIEDKDERIAALEKRLSEHDAATAARDARLAKLEQRLERLLAAADAPAKEGEKASR